MDPAITASLTQSDSMASPSTILKHSRACASLSVLESSSKAYQGSAAASPSNDRRYWGKHSTTSSRQSPVISLKRVSEVPNLWRAVIAVARRLAVIMHRMRVNGPGFRWGVQPVQVHRRPTPENHNHIYQTLEKGSEN